MIDLFLENFDDLWPFVLIGFGAQVIDGALGMAFGVISGIPSSNFLHIDAAAAVETCWPTTMRASPRKPAP